MFQHGAIGAYQAGSSLMGFLPTREWSASWAAVGASSLVARVVHGRLTAHTTADTRGTLGRSITQPTRIAARGAFNWAHAPQSLVLKTHPAHNPKGHSPRSNCRHGAEASNFRVRQKLTDDAGVCRRHTRLRCSHVALQRTHISRNTILIVHPESGWAREALDQSPSKAN